MIIYKYLLNGKVYIGQTVRTMEIRHFYHVYIAIHGGTSHFYHAIRKYGSENLKYEIIEKCKDIDHLNEREKFWIKHYKSNDPKFGYNMTEGGDGTAGYHHSEEAIEKMRIAKIGKFAGKDNPMFGRVGELHPLFGKKGKDHPAYGKKLSQDAIDKIRKATTGKNNPFWGKKHSQESINKMIESNSGENSHAYGTCWMYNLELNLTKQIKKEEVEDHLNKGWIKGRKKQLI